MEIEWSTGQTGSLALAELGFWGGSGDIPQTKNSPICPVVKALRRKIGQEGAMEDDCRVVGMLFREGLSEEVGL